MGSLAIHPISPAGQSASLERIPCIIVGCGGHGRVVLDILLNGREYEVAGFVDSNTQMHGRRIDGVEVLDSPDQLLRIGKERAIRSVIIAIGNNGVRRSMADRMTAQGFELINAIHPSANLAHNVTLGRNTVVAAGALVCAHSQIGDSVILNTGCIIDHETFVGTATHVCPGARIAGRVTIESGAFVGIGATVIQSLRVGYESIIGAGAVVIHDVAPMSTVVGVPARPIKASAAAGDLRAWLMPELSRVPEFPEQIPLGVS